MWRALCRLFFGLDIGLGFIKAAKFVLQFGDFGPLLVNNIAERVDRLLLVRHCHFERGNPLFHVLAHLVPASAYRAARRDFPEIDYAPTLHHHEPIIEVHGRVAVAGDQTQFFTQHHAPRRIV